MCTLFCALIVCTLVSTVRTANTADAVTPEFESEEKFEDQYSTFAPRTTSIANGKYGSKTTQDTQSVTDPNDSLNPNESVTDNATINQTKPENDNILSDKNNSYTTEPIPTTNDNQSLEEPTTRVQLPITTVRLDDGSTTTPDTPSGTDLNDTMVSDDAGGSPTKDFIGSSQKPANKKYSSPEPFPTNDNTQTKLKEPQTKIASTARTTYTTTVDPNVSKFNSTEDDTFEDDFFVQLPSTTFVAIRKNGSTTTPGTPSVNSSNPKNNFNQSHKKYSTTEPIPTNDDSKLEEHITTVEPVTIRSNTNWDKPVTIRSNTKWDIPVTIRSKTKWSIPVTIRSRTKWSIPVTIRSRTKWSIPVTIRTNWSLLNPVTDVLAKKEPSTSKNDEKETTTAKSLGRSAELFEQWKQRFMRETTTSNFEGQSAEESQESKQRQKILEMESKRFEAILDVLRSRK